MQFLPVNYCTSLYDINLTRLVSLKKNPTHPTPHLIYGIWKHQLPKLDSSVQIS